MRQAAFTLLETIIVVALVVAISAVVLPSLASRVTAGRVGQAVVSIETSASMARAEAMERGVPLALHAERIGREWVLFVGEITTRGAGEFPAGGERGEPWELDAGGAVRREVGSFAGVELTDGLPSFEDPGGEAAVSEAPPAPEGAPGLATDPAWSEPPLERRLAVFFPDGTCRADAPIYLAGPDGSRRVIRLGALAARLDVRILPTEQEELRARASGDPSDRLLPGGEEGNQ